MNIKIFKTKEELYQVAANLIIDQVRAKSSSILGLATGSTPIPLYRNLIKDYEVNKTNYSNVITFNLDEYIGLSSDHPESYLSFMRANLFNYIPFKKSYLPNGNAIDPGLECQKYEKLLNENPIDLQILGIGSNGHIGFNEPGTPFDSLTHIVTLAKQTRIDNARFFNNLDEVPTHAITMGIESIMKAKTVLLIALGRNKAQAVKDMVHGEVNVNMPASILQEHSDVYVFLDSDAASLL